MESKGFGILASLAFFSFVLFFIISPPALGGEKSPTAQPWNDWSYSEKAVRGGEFRVSSTVDVGLLNPHHWPVMDWNVIDMLYEQYVAAGESVILYPWVSESWEFTDPMTCIVKFREGITFHDGTPLNAEVVKYNFEWIMNKKNSCWDRSYIEWVESMELVDEHTVKFRFSQPFASFIGNFQTPQGYVISMKALKGDTAAREMKTLELKVKRSKKKLSKLGKKAKKAEAQGGSKAKKAKAKYEKAQEKHQKLETLYAEASEKAKGAKSTDTDPVGTGPYMLDSRSSGNWIKVKRNPNYWFAKMINRQDLPFFDSIKTIIIPDRSIQLANLKVGKIHLMELSPSQYSQIQQKPHPAVRIDALSMPHTSFLYFNHAKGSCKDIRVRQAISHAVDRKALITGVLFGLGRPASCLFPDDQWSHNPNLKPVAYDPEKAKNLLREAGYEKGLSIEGYADTNPEAVTIVEAVKHMLAEVGIDWKVDTLEASAWSDRLTKLAFDLSLGTWSYIFDPDMPAHGMYHPKGGFNYGRTVNKKAIELIEAGKAESNFAKRQKIYWDMEKILYDNYEDVWLWHSRMARGFHKSVIGSDAKMYETWQDVWKRTHFMIGLSFASVK